MSLGRLELRMIMCCLGLVCAIGIMGGADCIPVPGGTCPDGSSPVNGSCQDSNVPTSTTILSQVQTLDKQAIPGGSNCATASMQKELSFSATIGKQVTVTVTGPTTASRPQIVLSDMADNILGNSGQNPTSNVTVTTFTPAATAEVDLVAIECSTTAVAGNYTFLVEQAP